MQIEKIINKKLWCILAMAFFMSSCTFTEPTIGNFNFKSMSPKEDGNFRIEVEVKVDNPNNYNIWLKKGKFDILMGNQKMGTVHTVGKVVLKKQKNDYYIIKAETKLNPDGALLGMLTGLTSGGNKPVTLKGDIRAGVFIFSKKFDIEFSDKLPSMSLFGN